jgi:hypothetical protein
MKILILPHFIHRLYPIWIKFGTGSFYKNLLSDCTFHEIRCSKIHILLKRVNEYLTVLPT